MKLPNTGNTKLAVQTHALRLFAADGYSAVSMRDIADAVGIQPGAIYNHFASKQQMLSTLMASHLSTLLDALESEMRGIETPVKRLHAFARFHVGYHIDYPDDVFLAYMELRSLEPKGYERIRAMRNQYERVLRDILTDGSKAGDFSVRDPAVHTRAILSMLTGITVWYRDGGRLNREQVIDSYVMAAMQSVGLEWADKKTPHARRQR